MMLEVLMPKQNAIQHFVLVPVSTDNAVSMECPYSFAVHISNEYCGILVLCS